MSTQIENTENIPLPPPDAEVLTTACCCIVACSYKVYRWPVGREGGTAADQNAFGVDFPTGGTPWISRAMHNIGMHEGREHHMVVIPDPEADVVNRNGNHSVRGGTLAQKIYNPDTPTRDRLKYPMIRVAVVHEDLLLRVFREHLRHLEAGQPRRRHAGLRPARQAAGGRGRGRARRLRHQLVRGVL